MEVELEHVLIRFFNLDGEWAQITEIVAAGMKQVLQCSIAEVCRRP